MKNTFKLTYLLALSLLLTAFGCSNDDEGTVEINLQNLEVTIDENPTNGDVVGTVQSDSNSALTFGITTQTPSGALSINPATGELIVADGTLFDFETNPTITATVAADEAVNDATVTININNTNELSTQDFTATIDENPTDGQVIGAIQATGDATLSFSITSQTPTGALNIDATTGELTVADPNLFDFETNPVITADILVDNSGNTETVTATLTLNDLDEVDAQNLNVAIDENPTNGQAVGTIPATGGNLVFTITFQNPVGAFNINSSTGELTVADATLFDFETNPNMLATVSVENSVNMVSVNAIVSLNDKNEVGEFKYGGVIFWIDPASNNSSGLVCAINDQGGDVQWGCYGTNIPSAQGVTIGTGSSNTLEIVSNCPIVGIAADLANDASNGYNDWFLPSQDELNEMYLNKTIINSTATANGGGEILNSWYWTSTQQNGNANNAYFQYFGNGLQTLNAKANLAKVRAVRAWTDF